MVESLLKHDLFEYLERSGCGRPKDAIDWFGALSEEKKGDFIHSAAYGLISISEELYGILSVARGDDDLNQPIDGENG